MSRVVTDCHHASVFMMYYDVQYAVG